MRGISAPDQPDLEARIAGQARAPGRRGRVVCLQIGAIPRDGFHGGVEQAWKAQQGRVAIEGGQGLFPIGHEINTLGRGEDARQGAGRLDDDPAAERLDQGGVADELKGGAGALFGGQEDGLALQGPAGPGARRESAGFRQPASRRPSSKRASPRFHCAST